MVTKKSARRTFTRNSLNNQPDVLTTIATLRSFGQNFLSTADYLEATVKIGADTHGIVGMTGVRSGSSPGRILSVSARRKIALAQKKRWAKSKTGSNVTTMSKKQAAAAA